MRCQLADGQVAARRCIRFEVSRCLLGSKHFALLPRCPTALRRLHRLGCGIFGRARYQREGLGLGRDTSAAAASLLSHHDLANDREPSQTRRSVFAGPASLSPHRSRGPSNMLVLPVPATQQHPSMPLPSPSNFDAGSRKEPKFRRRGRQVCGRQNPIAGCFLPCPCIDDLHTAIGSEGAGFAS